MSDETFLSTVFTVTLPKLPDVKAKKKKSPDLKW